MGGAGREEFLKGGRGEAFIPREKVTGIPEARPLGCLGGEWPKEWGRMVKVGLARRVQDELEGGEMQRRARTHTSKCSLNRALTSLFGRSFLVVFVFVVSSAILERKKKANCEW